MLQSVHLADRSIEAYRRSAGEDVAERLRAAAVPVAGAKVLHLSATPYGGGVAEILRSEVPLLRDLGLVVDWRLVTGDDEFFAVTKRMHNALQGADIDLSSSEHDTYLAYSGRNAALLDEHYDLVVVHDPQPLAVASLMVPDDTRWIWRCHIDTAEPDPGVWEFLRTFLEPYSAAVFTLPDFVPPGFPDVDVVTIPPAIDPESPKNVELGERLCRRVCEWIGVDLARPLMTQISRFDPWKDPLGVIEVYRRATERVPGLQLALVGAMALDDPEGWEMYRDIEDAIDGDRDIHVFTNLTGVGNIEVNAFQRLSDVVIQKSLREGFGLVVSEALWKATPVVAGRAGGIVTQLRDPAGGFLVDSIEECADRAVEVIEDPELRSHLGRLGQERVREEFLLPRLVADDLRLYAEVLG